MTKNEYNGWYNYETWVVNLWMSNDEGSSRYYDEIAGECLSQANADATFTKEERATLNLAAMLKDEFEEKEQEIIETANVQASVWADLLGAALSEVNWHDIAEHLIDAAKESLAEA